MTGRQPNVEATVRIEAVGHRGDGLARTGGGALYVPLSLPGETVRVEASDRRARLVEVIEASPERAEPFCPHFGTCGGCALQHWREAPYRRWKRELVKAAFAGRGIAAEVGELIDAHGSGRRRATFHARRMRGKVECGFMALRSHRIADLDRCPVLAPGLALGPAIARGVGDILARDRPIDIVLTLADTGTDCDIRGAAEPNISVRARLADFLRRRDLARISVGGETVAEAHPPTLRFGPATVTLPPGAFLQPTAEGERVLWEEVRRRLGSPKRVADLFCGAGPFALRMAEFARGSAFDGDGASIAALTAATRRTSGLKPVEAYARDLFREPLMARELKGFDAVVIDPPRQGAEAQARELAKSAVPLIVAVSCEPATLARDAAILIEGGYRMGAATPVDQFKWAPHVECVVAFVRD